MDGWVAETWPRPKLTPPPPGSLSNSLYPVPVLPTPHIAAEGDSIAALTCWKRNSLKEVQGRGGAQMGWGEGWHKGAASPDRSLPC